jgi:MprA protease rhombosortase-interaction domain-containing protein
MIAPGAAFLTYLWHYMVGRLIYEELVRGHVPAAVLVVAAGLVGFALRRRRRT